MLSEGLSWEVFLECDADLLSTGGVDPMAPERSGEEKGARLAEGRDEDEKVFPGKRQTSTGGRGEEARRNEGGWAAEPAATIKRCQKDLGGRQARAAPARLHCSNGTTQGQRGQQSMASRMQQARAG